MNYIKRQEPERHIRVRREKVIEKIIEKESKPIDINAIVNAIVNAINSNQNSNNQIINKNDGFDNSKTLEKLATTMTTQKNNNQANFNNLGNEQKTETDKNEVAKTIDLLSKLND